MEPDILESLRIYLEEGSGCSDTVIDALASGYHAYAQSVNIMSDWLVTLGDVPPEDPPPGSAVKKPKRGRRGAKQSAKKAQEEKKAKEEEKAKESDTPKSPSKKHDADKKLEPFYGKMEAAKSVENTLASLIAKHFSPDTADTIFEDGGVIEWLPELINHRRWRTLLYELMDQYPNCLMLNFAVKLISDAGFQTEISTVSSAAQQLDIFSRVLLTSIDTVLAEHRKGCITAAYEKAFGELVRVVCQAEHTYVYTMALLKLDIFSRVLLTSIDTVLAEHRKGCITAAYEKAFGELVRVVCQAEHTYVYTMALLKAVGSSQGGRILAACEQMSESLRAEMDGREHETTALRTALAQTADDQVASHFTQALLNMVSRGELNPADVTIIYDQYILPLPPPISIIRDPIFIELLLDSLFHYEGPKTIPEHRFKYIFLLACAASVSETRNSSGRRTVSAQYHKKDSITKAQEVILRTAIVRQSWELSHDDVELTKKLGEVAINLAKMEVLTKEQIKEIMHEARLMRHFILKFYGVAAGQELLMVVMELVNCGALDSYLQKSEQPLNKKDEMCLQAAWGLEYLHEKNVLHRDIAARICLFGDDSVKVYIKVRCWLENPNDRYSMAELAKHFQRTQQIPRPKFVENPHNRILLEGMDDLLAELNELLHAIKMPVVAAGVLYYVQTLLLSEEKTGDPPGAALCLLDHIATLHPNLHAKAFDVCCQLYEKIAGENEAAEVIMERQRLVVDRLVHLLSVGGTIPVLEKVWEMFRDGQIDASLVRYFAMEAVLDIFDLNVDGKMCLTITTAAHPLYIFAIELHMDINREITRHPTPLTFFVFNALIAVSKTLRPSLALM
ncbi:unnamed protein product [Heligmosomoides polygyrus]|uniref:Protein kinase domain-containing protein n=1 Tax=Heligmosomoides polygyrus TaxID=6339 RepID=A0A3P8BFH8_HELPZ|nr:unnamed protein product [Heligmosomoides polygyrus]